MPICTTYTDIADNRDQYGYCQYCSRWTTNYFWYCWFWY